MVRQPRAAAGTPLRSISEYAAPTTPAAALDEIDLRLLQLLSDDARLSRRRLAHELGMSAPAVGERIARLERSGVILGYSARLDWGALGYPTTVLITVTANQGYQQGVIMQELMAVPEVEDVLLVTGEVDMVVRAHVRDHTHLRDLLLNQVWQIEGIQRTETSLAIAEMPPKNRAVQLLTPRTMADPGAVTPTSRTRSLTGGTHR